MTLNLCCSSLSPPHLHTPTAAASSSSPFPKPNLFPRPKHSLPFPASLLRPPTAPPSSSSSDHHNDTASPDLVACASAARDADEALRIIIASSSGAGRGGSVPVPLCCSVISAALGRSNCDLALSIFSAMRASSFAPGESENGSLVAEGWKWPRPDVEVYACLVLGLAASLKVSDALRMLDYVSRVGVSPGEEVLFGKVVRCPTCLIAIAVTQPQQGIQIASCAKCRYQYELVSGDVVSIDSEEISMDIPAWKRGLRFLQIMKQSLPAAVHSIVVQTPSGLARTHRFATETVDLPAQEGERVTIASAAPSGVYRNIGPLRVNPKAANRYHGEPMCLTNHKDGRESLLLRAPAKDGNLLLLNPSILIPLLAALAAGDAASGLIDPSLPQFLSAAAIASLGVGATLNTLVLPQLSKLPQRSADVISIKQQLLSQYDVIQSRIRTLKEASGKEVWMLARMCQLENKIFAVGEPSYRARRTKVKRVREGLEDSIKGRIELIDSYARISSMIEIEVEMDSDVLAAEAVSYVDNIAEQIQQVMELENLEERWKVQAEANDEAERLLSQPVPTEMV